jgi:phosphoglycerate dehydrogenase-like enzyme
LKPLIAIEPKSFAAYEEAVIAAGGEVVALSPDVASIIWTDYASPELLRTTLLQNPQITWVQLPFAGVDAFAEIIEWAETRPQLRITSAKGSYSEPVAEHALALSLALARVIPERAKAESWGRKFAFSFYDSNIVIVGAGGITTELLKFLSPFRAKITLVRNRPGLDLVEFEQIAFGEIDSVLPAADLVFLACALTDETRHLINAARLSLMKPTSYLVNVARGPVVDTQALVSALNEGLIAGAATDVTDPEPLPDGHPLWSAKNMLITPHTADTKEMVLRMFAERIRVNVLALQGLCDWVGTVDSGLGY